ncbi:MAG TPA: tRNA (5-methylaminomethyl-2-thiouridine)(34)-methyltransferase MnmD [Caulobacteraceae bacterium]|jgi:tRNA 5-methylaminomethyl-2-thiouridine biosynthesis bifunctional protein
MSADVSWSPEGTLRSRRFDDIYFNDDGLAESRAVFLAGCGIPEAWAGRRRFTVCELGFGAGLNVLALFDLWRRSRPEGARLHVFSVEAFPLPREDAARALGAFPEVGGLAARLLEQWPRVGAGWERAEFAEIGATLDVAIGDAAEGLRAWSGAADAWFLDGFAPAKNPEMWRDEVLDLVRERSAPGARLATFTVAGAVRRGLAERGFEVSRAAGHARKKERLEARLPGVATERPLPSVAVIGGGVAGASSARAFRRLGVEARVVDPSPGGGASGNPAALVSPRLDVGGGTAAQLYAQAWRRAGDLYRREAAEAVVATGALRLQAGAKDGTRFERLSESPLFRRDALQRLTVEEGGEQLCETVDEAPLLMTDALTVAPAALLDAWLPSEVLRATAAALRRTESGWGVVDAGGAVLVEAEVVCVAAGAAVDTLTELQALEPVRGQATWSGPLDAPVFAATWGSYAAPTPEGGVIFGATHERGRAETDVRPEDDARNLAALAARRPKLAEAAASAGLTGRASVRAATRDRLPLAGEVAPGLFVLGGLGGRGFTTAPLLAEHVAALAVGAPSPLPQALAAAVAPTRFAAGDRTARVAADAEQQR